MSVNYPITFNCFNHPLILGYIDYILLILLQIFLKLSLYKTLYTAGNSYEINFLQVEFLG